MSKSTTTTKAKFQSFLTIFTLMFATVSIFSSLNSTKVQAGAGNVDNLIVSSKTSTDGVNFTQNTISNSGNYTKWNCGSQTFVGQESQSQNKGISDLDDGISKKSEPKIKELDERQTDCGKQKIKAQGQPVFAYQYSYEYKFPSDKRSSESNRYRVHTNQSGDYDGVQYTYTFYNYWNLQKNDWNGWENPNTSNEFKGWLAYAVGGNTQNNTPSLSTGLPSLGDGSSTANNVSNLQTYTNPNYPNLKINYDNSWKMERESIPRSDGADLNDGKITLTKKDAQLTFKLYSSGAVRGTGFGPMEMGKNQINANIMRYKFQNVTNSPIFYEYFFSGEGASFKNSLPPSVTKIKTNIKYDPSKHFGGMTGNANLLEMCREQPTDCDVKDNLLLFTLETKLTTEDQNLVQEADNIIKNSIFR